MRLRAIVKRVTGKTKHTGGEIVAGKIVPVETFPAPAWVEIPRRIVLSTCFISTRREAASRILGIKRWRMPSARLNSNLAFLPGNGLLCPANPPLAQAANLNICLIEGTHGKRS